MLTDVRDTFLHFLADNLTPSQVPVRSVRHDPNDPSAEMLQVNSVNVQFLAVNPTPAISSQMVAIDVLNEDEGTAIYWVGLIWNLLSAAFYTPLLNYADLANPVPAGTNIIWDTTKVRFVRVYNDHYCHYSCTISLGFVAA